MPIGNIINSPEMVDRQEGDLGSFDILSLNLTEDQVARAIGNRVETAETYWNAKLGLDNVRQTNEKIWLNDSIDASKFYDFQVPYKDNRIFTAVESLIPMALSSLPQPLVQQGTDTYASYELAENLGKILLAKSEDLYLKRKYQQIARYLLIGKRVAYAKLRWDGTIGRIGSDGKRAGDIAVDTPRPERVVVSEGASDPDNIPLIGEYLTATVEELCFKYPKKQYEIYKEMGISRGVPSMMSKRTGYMEVWFTFYGQNGEPREGLAWKLGTVVLDSSKNPNWNYVETTKDAAGNDVPSNFLDRPMKPYIVFNHLNLGRYIIDDTSLIEQAATLQSVLEKRGRQIVENADQANGGTIFNAEMVKQEDVAQLIGDPNEKMMVKGDVTKAVMRMPLNQLGEYVIEDKNDARAEIDNIFATHDPLRGEGSGNKTLGQDVLSQRSDISRINTLATSIEDGADRLYKQMVQFFKVFYTEPIDVQYMSKDGKTSFIPFSQASIENGMGVRVKSGSVLPKDPIAEAQQTIQTMAVLDPLSLAEGLNKPEPKEFAKRIFYFRASPDKYASDILGIDPQMGDVDPSAAQEDSMLANEQEVPPAINPSKAHLATHDAWLKSPQFKNLSPKAQQMTINLAKTEMNNVQSALGQPVDEGTPPEEGQETPPVEQGEGEQPGNPMPGAPPPQAPPVAAPAPQATPTNSVPPRGIPGAVRALISKITG